MEKRITCGNRPVNVVVELRVDSPRIVRVRAMNPNRPSTYYTDRIKTVNSSARFEIRMPQNCENIRLLVTNEDGSHQGITFDKVEKRNLEQHLNCISTPRTKSFIEFAQEFCEKASVLSTGTYLSDDHRFQIDYLPVITDSGRALSTPARISQKTGRIEISKAHFQKDTVPMRMAILCHEYSHFNLNQVREDEIEADLNALRIYLGLGYPIIEAHKGFLRVFKKSPSKQNYDRYQYIKAYIDDYDNIKHQVCA